MMHHNWGILGAGTIAREMAQALHTLWGGAYAIAGRTRANAERLAEEYSIARVYDSVQQLLADPAVETVYIATPHNLHYEMMKEALLAGKHVLCEKAIAVNSTQLAEIRALARERGLVVEEAMTLYHMPIYRAVRRQLEQGMVGRVNMIQVNFGSCKPYDVTNRFFSPDLAGGALLDIGVYALSFVRYFMEEKPDRILTSARFFETGVDEQSGIVLTNSLGQMAVVSLSMRAKQPKRGVVSGNKGYIEISDYPRADRASIHLLSESQPQCLSLGDTARALEYEVLDMEARLNGESAGFEELTDDVMELMTEIRRQWGMRYPFE